MKKIVLIALIQALCSVAKAQIPVEFFAGHERSTIDIMFFKYFKNFKENPDVTNSRWLFFNRNRASIDYKMTQTTHLPLFGFTEAISYNHEKLKGIAPVVVGQVLSWGVFPKAGIQYAHINKNTTLFTWLVCETLKKPDLDYFFLFRYTPNITEKIRLFTQVESVNAFSTVSNANFSFTQRLRIGIQRKTYQIGVGVDLNQMSRNPSTTPYNLGFFIRNEF